MNYQRIYDELIARAVARGTVEGYSERHHIVPRCLGGGNERDNLVDLTAREHFIAHVLLAKVHPQEKGLVYAAWMMATDNSRGRTYKVQSRTYETLKVQCAQMGRARMNELAAQGLSPLNNPVTAAKQRESLKEVFNRPEVRAANSARVKEQWSDPVYLAKMREAQNRPEVQAAKSTFSVAQWDARYAAEGKTRPVIPHPKAGTKREQIWSLADTMTAELGYPVPSNLLQAKAAEHGISTKHTASVERDRWYRFHYIQNNQMKEAA